MRVALTNDDGIFSFGLRSLYKALIKSGHQVSVIAPMTEQSGVGRSVTCHTPLQIKAIEEDNFIGTGVFGTPTDCVKLGLSELLPDRPDIFLSGINLGFNAGPDIFYSGTVSAAAEAACHDVPALAISSGFFKDKNMLEQAQYAVKIMESLPWKDIPKRRVINLNLPGVSPDKYKGLQVCPATTAAWNDFYHQREDHRARPYWWLDGAVPQEHIEKDSDKAFLEAGFATLTPLNFSFTDDGLLSLLKAKVK